VNEGGGFGVQLKKERHQTPWAFPKLPLVINFGPAGRWVKLSRQASAVHGRTDGSGERNAVSGDLHIHVENSAEEGRIRQQGATFTDSYLLEYRGG
jgi:hypothetical protein